MMRVQAGVLIVACGILLGTDVTRTQPPASPPGQAIRPQVQGPDRHDVSPALRDMPVIPPSAAGRQPFPPRPVWRGRLSQVPAASDPALQTSAPLFSAPTASASFEGVNNLNSVLPPDTNGDIGPNHYVQWVNLSFAIYSRTGDVLYGPANGSSLWQGFGGPCETRNDGDPIVLYDEHADRWLMSQFALPNFPSGPFYQCIAVSQTGNPLGSYHRYQYSFSKLNDYPKFGVWPDGYYMSINQFTCSGKGPFVSCSWAGQGVAAFNRTQMLAGGSATMVYRDMFSTDDTLGGMLPSDLDGPLPPAGTPNYYMQFDDDAWGYSPDQLQIWEFKVNWSAPTTSTFTKKATLPTVAFDSNMCGYNRSCIAQAGTTVKLDAISDRVMYRLQYRNFGTHGTLVTNHTVDVNGQDHAGVRWYEVRLNNGTPSIHQQGTFAPDTNHRWMASAAMDKAGNIAMGYNVSSSTSFPRISFTGRKVTDTAGQMTLGEGDIMLGTGSQTHSSSRWGDYSLLAVDPTDGCTFWFTTEYLSDTSSIGWRTRVGAFQIEGCTSGGGGGTDPLEAPSNLTVTSVSATQVGLSWTDNSDDETNFRVERCTGSSCSTFSEAGTSTTSTFTDTVAANTYSYRVRAWRSSDNVFSSYSSTVTAVMPPGAPTITSATASSSSQINLAWSDNSTNEANFHVDRCEGTGCSTFAEIAVLPAGTTSYSSTGLLAKTTYGYRVRATNTHGSTLQTSFSNTVHVTTPEQSTAPTMHVGNLSGVGIKASGPNWFARVTILVVDNNGNAVSGATVTGSWTGTTGPTSCATGSNGSCSLDSAGVHNRVGSVSFTVTNVTHTSLSYNSEGNSATSVVITKP